MGIFHGVYNWSQIALCIYYAYLDLVFMASTQSSVGIKERYNKTLWYQHIVNNKYTKWLIYIMSDVYSK